jgi:hypothetical protein
MNNKKVRAKFLRSVGIIAMLSLLIAMPKSFAGSFVETFTLKNCDKENVRCLTITGKKAEGSDLAPLFYFKHAIVLIEKNNKLDKQFINVEGYFDLSLGRVVVSEKIQAKSVDNVIDLNNLELTQFTNY